MKHNTVYSALGLFAALINAHPLLRRDMEWVTETAVFFQTVDTYVTAWVFPDGSPVPTTIPEVGAQAYSTASPVEPAYGPLTTIAAATAPAPTTWSAWVASVPATTNYPPAAPASTYIPPLWSAPVYTPSPSAPGSTFVAPAPATTYMPPVPTPTPSAADSGSDSGSSTFTGDMTHYDVGLGSCGWTNTPTENVVAIPVGQMNNPANPNSNPLCGKTVNISYGGKTTQAQVVDTCMGCADGALDMSDSLFEYFAPLGAGRLAGMTWNFAD